MKNHDTISKRELEVLDLISYGYSSLEIAKKLTISFETVTSHRKNLLRKLKANNAAALVRIGMELGILKIPCNETNKI